MNCARVLICIVTGLMAASPALADRPNIILVMADDQGWGDMAYNGHPHLKTPHFDSAAKTGITFSRFYAAAPVCSPTRASVLTGRHPNRMGVFKWGYPMRPQEVTIAEVLRENGYATAHFGKWHLGSLRTNSATTPARNGFKHWISSPNFFDNDPILCRRGRAVQYEGESSIVTADLAIEWIEAQSQTDTPFFAVVWFGSPHNPHRASDEDLAQYADLFADEERGNLRRNKKNFLGEVTGMDRAYGKLRESLRQLGIEDNTILWYTSDNGALKNVGNAGEFRGHKGQIYDGGLLVPSILHWPLQFESPKVLDARCNSSDIFPTLLDFAGIEYETDRPMDGVSLNRLINGDNLQRNPMGFWDFPAKGRSVPADRLMTELLEAQTNGRDLTAPGHDVRAAQLPTEPLGFDRFPGHSAWIKNDWKLHRIENEQRITYELYDLEHDINESDNLVNKNPQKVEELKPELETWLQSVAASYNGDDYSK